MISALLISAFDFSTRMSTCGYRTVFCFDNAPKTKCSSTIHIYHIYPIHSSYPIILCPQTCARGKSARKLFVVKLAEHRTKCAAIMKVRGKTTNALNA
jgi:hypothetical protein